MYLPTHFKQDDQAELFDLIEHHPLGTLIVMDADGLEVNHIPFELDRLHLPTGILRGHIAKANPLALLLSAPQSAYVIFQAEQHYISPNWYLSKQEHRRVVPTWNYRVVHVTGTLHAIHDQKYLRGVLARLTRQNEADQPVPWRLGDAPEDFIEQQLEKIMAIEFRVESIIGKFKLSQNRSQADVTGVITALNELEPNMANSIHKYFPK